MEDTSLRCVYISKCIYYCLKCQIIRDFYYNLLNVFNIILLFFILFVSVM